MPYVNPKDINLTPELRNCSVRDPRFVDSLRALHQTFRRIGLISSDHIDRAISNLEPEKIVKLNQQLATLPHQSILAITNILGIIADGNKIALKNLHETSRPAIGLEPQTVQLHEMAVGIKSSKLELDLQSLNLTQEQLILRYEQEGVDSENVLRSHAAQLKSRAKIREIFPPEQILEWNQISTETLKKFKVIFALGGDDTGKHVSGKIDDAYYLGINSDREDSKGALMQVYPEDMDKVIAAFATGNFKIQEWTRLKVEMNGNVLPLAMSEVNIMAKDPRFAARVSIDGKVSPIAIKATGLIISNGAGSTGWFRSSTRYLNDGQDLWARTAPYAQWAVREPYGEPNLDEQLQGDLQLGDMIIIRSGMNHESMVDVDSVEKIPFPRGTKAKISFGKPLKVVIPKIC